MSREHFQSDCFRARYVRALAIVTAALAGARRPYISFSGGKDSTAAAILALTVRDDIPLMWSDDELEMPETVDYVRLWRELAGDQVIVLRQSRSVHAGWFVPWVDRPYWREPLPGSRHVPSLDAAGYMAHQGYDLCILGTRGGESRRRRDWLVHQYAGTGASTYTVSDGTRRCCPLWDWTTDDVWALIAGRGIPHNEAYDRMLAARIAEPRQRVGPLPLVPRETMLACWPDELERLEARYGNRWL